MNRIALLTLNMNGYGTERSMLTLARGFVERGIAVDLLLVNTEGALLAQVPDGVRVISLAQPRVLAPVPMVRYLSPLVRYLRRERPTALLSSFEQINVVALWARRIARVRTRVVVSTHFPFSQHYLRHSHRLRDRRILRPLVRRFYPWADAVVAVSRWVAEDLAAMAGLPLERIRVIYNPVEPDLIARAAQPPDHPWFAPGEPPVVLGVGRLTAQKDFPTLVRAFQLVRQRQLARLLILGEGEWRAGLEALIGELGLEGEVALPGYADNPYPYMTRAAVFALSSAWEALPVVLLEVLTLGTPIVATDCPSGPSEILEGGRWGTLVPVADPAALAEAITAVLAGARPTAPPEEAGERFRLEQIVDQYLEVLFGADGAQVGTAVRGHLRGGQEA